MIPIIVDPFQGEKQFSSDSHFGSDTVSEDSTASIIKRVGYFLRDLVKKISDFEKRISSGDEEDARCDEGRGR